MAETKRPTSSSSSSSSPPSPTKKSLLWRPFTLFVTLLLPTFIAVVIYQLESFDPVAYPTHELNQNDVVPTIPKINSNMLRGAGKVGVGKLIAPEDLAYDAKAGLIYTGCVDGWIKRVKVSDSVADSVVDWVNTGGRPLGLVLGHHGELIVADADKGLLNVTADGVIHLLTDEADGLKFKLTDGVDIASNGVLYFTDASYKYMFKEFIWDFLEGRPHGRLLSYDPSTKETRVLVKNLYFANGVSLSTDQKFVIFCETALRCCKKYYREGEKKGSVEMFISNMPGMPDNIRYDGEGHYWIGFSTEKTYGWDLALRYPSIRKVMAIMEKSIGRPHMEKNGGALAVDLEGRPVAYYHDPALFLISTCLKIRDHLYCGSVVYPYIIRLNLTQHPAVPAA